jgi:tRNA (adenine37-N6)-methyltransferase
MEPGSDGEKLKLLLSYWIDHEKEHIRNYDKWIKKAEDMGLKEVARELKKAILLSKKVNRYIESANKKLEEDFSKPLKISKPVGIGRRSKTARLQERPEIIKFRQIGIIRTPYTQSAPYQPVTEDEGDFHIVINPVYTGGLLELDKFHYIYVIYYINRINQKLSMTVTPHWAGGAEVGVFASRSPVRPNPIGLSIVRIKKIVNDRIYTTGLDVFDRTPLLDIKPYIKDLDSKPDANYGWVREINGSDHLILHIKGIPHHY